MKKNSNEVSYRVAVILLTWKRLHLIKKTLAELEDQTFKNFDLYISHGDVATEKTFKKELKRFMDVLNIKYCVENNDNFCFRRYEIARKNAKDYDIFFFLDDDVTIPKNYIEKSIKQFYKKSYQSGYAHSFITDPPNYKDRLRHHKKNKNVGYCGAGMSMIDSSIFENKNFFDNPIIKNNYKFDDIWLSYFSWSLGWKLDYLDSGAVLGGDDDVAMYQKIMDEKNIFLKELLKLGWTPPIENRNVV
jgi:hypothetical protein